MQLFYDFLIFGFLILDGILIILFLVASRQRVKMRPGEYRRIALGRSLLFCACIGAWAVIFYGSFIESQLLVVAEKTVSIGKNPTKSIRAVLVSDLHAGPYKKSEFVNKIADKILALKPDLILLAGDYVYDDVSQMEYLEPLKRLKAPLGVFAILGNHDYTTEKYLITEEDRLNAQKIQKKLESLGATVLINKGKRLITQGKELFLFGTDDIWADRADIDAAFRSVGRSQTPHPGILVGHNPDIIFEAQKKNLDLVLAGHTHGGQIRLPWLGPVPEIPDRLGQKFDRGLFQFGNTQLFITSGAGESGPRARLLVPPEIALLTIKF